MLIIVDGSDELGVIGIRARLRRMELVVWALVAMHVVTTEYNGANSSLLSMLLEKLMGGL